MNVDRTDAEFVQKVSKTSLKGRDEKGVNYVYPMEWINPKGETQKGNIMINAEMLKNRTKQIDNFQFFETNHRNLFYTKEALTATEQNFSPTDISETDLRDIKLDQLFVWDFRGMFENLKQVELLTCHIETLHRAMILTTPNNGNLHQIFLNQQNALGTHAGRAGGILCVHRCA